MRKLTCILLSSFLLSGCVATAVVAGASSIASSVIYDKRGLNTIREDALIERKFYNVLDEQEEFDNSHIMIKAINRNVLLVGYVENNAQKNKAFNVAKSITKVNNVYNQLRVGKPSSAFDEAKDLWLAGRVKAELIKKKGLHSGQISILVHDSNLYLMGIVPNNKQAIATDVARKVSGVKKVITLFENAK